MKRMIDNKEYEALKSNISLVNTELGKAKDKGMYFALEEPTENEGVYTYAKLTLGNINPDIPLKIGDLIISFDNTDSTNVKASNIWKIDDVSNQDYVKVVLIGAVGGGKQLYQHNIFMQNSVDKKLTCQVTIINDSNVAFNYSSLKAWLIDKGFIYENSTHKWYNAKGHYSSGAIMGIDYVANSNAIFALQLNADFSSQTEGSISSANLNFIDTIIAL